MKKFIKQLWVPLGIILHLILLYYGAISIFSGILLIFVCILNFKNDTYARLNTYFKAAIFLGFIASLTFFVLFNLHILPIIFVYITDSIAITAIIVQATFVLWNRAQQYLALSKNNRNLYSLRIGLFGKTAYEILKEGKKRVRNIEKKLNQLIQQQANCISLALSASEVEEIARFILEAYGERLQYFYDPQTPQRRFNNDSIQGMLNLKYGRWVIESLLYMIKFNEKKIEIKYYFSLQAFFFGLGKIYYPLLESYPDHMLIMKKNIQKNIPQKDIIIFWKKIAAFFQIFYEKVLLFEKTSFVTIAQRIFWDPYFWNKIFFEYSLIEGTTESRLKWNKSVNANTLKIVSQIIEAHFFGLNILSEALKVKNASLLALPIRGNESLDLLINETKILSYYNIWNILDKGFNVDSKDYAVLYIYIAAIIDFIKTYANYIPEEFRKQNCLEGREDLAYRLYVIADLMGLNLILPAFNDNKENFFLYSRKNLIQLILWLKFLKLGSTTNSYYYQTGQTNNFLLNLKSEKAIHILFTQVSNIDVPFYVIENEQIKNLPRSIEIVLSYPYDIDSVGIQIIGFMYKKYRAILPHARAEDYRKLIYFALQSLTYPQLQYKYQDFNCVAFKVLFSLSSYPFLSQYKCASSFNKNLLLLTTIKNETDRIFVLLRSLRPVVRKEILKRPKLREEVKWAPKIISILTQKSYKQESFIELQLSGLLKDKFLRQTFYDIIQEFISSYPNFKIISQTVELLNFYDYSSWRFNHCVDKLKKSVENELSQLISKLQNATNNLVLVAKEILDGICKEHFLNIQKSIKYFCKEFLKMYSTFPKYSENLKGFINQWDVRCYLDILAVILEFHPTRNYTPIFSRKKINLVKEPYLRLQKKRAWKGCAKKRYLTFYKSSLVVNKHDYENNSTNSLQVI